MFYVLIISIIAAVASYHHMFKPEVEYAIETGVQNIFTADKNVTLVVLVVLATIIAPVTLAVLLAPEVKEAVLQALRKYLIAYD